MLMQQREYRRDVQAVAFLSQANQTALNPTAQQLDDHLQALGLSRTDGKNGTATPASEDPTQLSFAEIQPILQSYLRSQRQANQDGLLPLPNDLQQYLAQPPVQQRLDELEQFILSQPLPTWELEVEQLIRSQPGPSFFPIAHLQRLLLARSLARGLKPSDYDSSLRQSRSASVSANQPVAADPSLEAAWRLSEAIAARPDLLSQMLAGILQQQQLTLLRHLDLYQTEMDNGRWQQRLAQNQQQALFQALTFDQWAEYRAQQRRSNPNFAPSFPGHPFNQMFSQPLLKFSRLDWLAARQRNQQQLRASVLCDRNSTPAALTVTPHPLNPFGSGEISIFSQEWIKASDRMLSAELTQKVIEAKAIARRQQQWPKQLDNLESSVCPGLSWKYQRTPEGGIELGFDQVPHWRIGITSDFSPLQYRAPALETAISSNN